MSPSENEVLLTQIVPRLRSAIPRSVRCIGSEDHEELLQDGTAMAAKILLNANRNGKSVSAGNVAYYTLQHLKSGRRSVGYSSVDVLASATQLTRSTHLDSLNEDINLASESEEVMPMCEAISLDHEDPSTKAARNLDWQLFVDSQDASNRLLLDYLVEGWEPGEVAKRLRVSGYVVRQRKAQLKLELLDFFGEAVLEEATRESNWHWGLRAGREKVACRSERQREVN